MNIKRVACLQNQTQNPTPKETLISIQIYKKNYTALPF